MLSGIIFDLDGTLMDSGLDFDLIREEMGITAERPILETINLLPADESQRCHAILHEHELAGAHRATPYPGVVEFIHELDRRGLRRAIATRNRREFVSTMLARLPGEFDPVITRDDGPVKPDPWPVQTICERWGVESAHVAMIGDYWFDIHCGRAAGARTVYYSGGIEPHAVTEHADADHILPCFTRWRDLLAWLE